MQNTKTPGAFDGQLQLVPQGFLPGWQKQKNLHLAGLMADAGGFEPPTARFVAEYSIQLSYASGEYVLRQVLHFYSVAS